MTTTPAPGTRPRGRLGPIGIPQLLAVEVALATLLFIPAIPRPWLGGAAAAVLLFGLGFSRGRSWWGWAGQWLRWRSRLRADRRTSAEPGPGLQLSTIAERGIEVGVAFDGTGWFSAVRLDGDARPLELFYTLTDILNGSEVPVSSVQLVTRFRPSHESWFAVRLDVRGSHDVATDRGGGPIGVHRALSTVVRRLLKSVDGTDIHMHPMNERDLTQALNSSLGTDSSQHPHEHWKTWRTGSTAQVTYWLRGGLSREPETRELWTQLSELGDGCHTVSLALRKASARPGEKRLVLRCLVRLAAEDVEPLGRDLTTLARKHHAKLVRCNGVQGPASYASALSGGVW